MQMNRPFVKLLLLAVTVAAVVISIQAAGYAEKRYNSNMAELQSKVEQASKPIEVLAGQTATWQKIVRIKDDEIAALQRDNKMLVAILQAKDKQLKELSDMSLKALATGATQRAANTSPCFNQGEAQFTTEAKAELDVSNKHHSAAALFESITTSP